MLPKIMSTMEARDSRITQDLRAAEAARREADSTEEAYRARINESRAEALKVTAAAKQEGARATEARVGQADLTIREKTDAAEARLRSATDAALADIETVAAEAAQDMVSRLAGVTVGRDEAADAVKAAMANG